MDFSIIYQMRDKKFWWMDVIFYFTISLLMAAVLCYFIFTVKIFLQNKDIEDLDVALQTVGTDQQKDYEKTVSDYQKKINDFAGLIKNREFASRVFSFMEQQTLPNVWFSKFAMNKKNGEVILSGEADSAAVFSQQVANFEKNKHVKKITVLSSNLGYSGRTEFNLNILMDPKIFASLIETTNP
ncbi:MAG: hypothetical protein CEN87_48 [Parcubacteria group bacterium Licking1014_1]|nr:MAG: hypothetical protein CEN87_48 [Parcubacteria group bacterium Licking1014_1]